jgi:drug/metabolite transporter (DMT)-like permease
MNMKLGLVVATVAAIAWGYVYATKDNLVQSMNPLSLLAAFYITGAVILLPVAVYNRADMMGGVLANPNEFATAVVGVLVAEICIIWSISLLGGLEAGLVEVSYPIWTALALYLFYGKTPSMGTVLGGALVMTGIAVIALSKSAGDPAETPTENAPQE